GDLSVDHDIGELQAAAGTQDAVDLREHRLLVGNEVDYAVRDDDVERLVGDGQRLDQGLVQPDVRETHLAGTGLGPLEHRGGHVDADRAPRGADHLGGDQQVGARTAAEVEHDLALVDRAERE